MGMTEEQIASHERSLALIDKELSESNHLLHNRDDVIDARYLWAWHCACDAGWSAVADAKEALAEVKRLQAEGTLNKALNSALHAILRAETARTAVAHAKEKNAWRRTEQRLRAQVKDLQAAVEKAEES